MIWFIVFSPIFLATFRNLKYREIDRVYYDCALDVDRPWHARFLCVGTHADEMIFSCGDWLKSLVQPPRKYSPPGFKLLKDTQDALIELFVYDASAVMVGIGATLCAIVEMFNFSNENNMRYCSSEMAYAIYLYMEGIVYPGMEIIMSIHADIAESSAGQSVIYCVWLSFKLFFSVVFVLAIVLGAFIARGVFNAWVLRDLIRLNPGINIENIIHFGNGSYNAAITEVINVQGQWQKPVCG